MLTKYDHLNKGEFNDQTTKIYLLHKDHVPKMILVSSKILLNT